MEFVNLYECNFCGKNHDTNICPQLESSSKIRDKTVPSRAKLTLPSNLKLIIDQSNLNGVFARETLNFGTRFGPFEAPLVPELKTNPTIPFKIFKADGNCVFLDSSDENNCNWMCLVSPSSSQSDCNLSAFQLNENIYFSARKEILNGDELKVTYAPPYARKMKQINPKLVINDSQCPDSTNYANLNENGPETETNVLVSNKLICETCSEVFNYSRDFAKHLQSHLKPIKKRGPEFRNNIKKIMFKKRIKNKINIRKSVLSCLVVEDDSKSVLKGNKCKNDFKKVFKYVERNGNDSSSKYNLRTKRKALVLSESDFEDEEEVEKEEKRKDEIEEIDDDGFSDYSEEETTNQNVPDDKDVNRTLFNQPSTIVQELLNVATLKIMEVRAIEDSAESLLALGASIVSEVPSSKSNEQLDNDHRKVTNVNVENSEKAVEIETETNDEICVLCRKTFSNKDYLYRHLRKHTEEFTCQYCRKVFSRKENLKVHRCPLFVDLLCSFCGKQFTRDNNFKKHLAEHLSHFNCRFCGKKYLNNESLAKHACYRKNVSPNFHCQFCGKYFALESYLEKHVPVHTGQFACRICGKWLRSIESLTNHLRLCCRVKEIDETGSVQCNQCQTLFTDVPNYRKHMYSHSHRFSCESCGAKFAQNLDFKSHSCQWDQFFCEICEFSFPNEISLLEHKTDHGKANFKCDVCQLYFYSEESLVDHPCNLNCENDSELKKSNVVHKQSPSSIACEICGALFSSRSALNVHKNVHGEKKFSCPVCNKRFHRKTFLVEHQLVHSREAFSFKCQDCEKYFKTKKSMEVHSRLHDGIKKFMCTTCGKSFSQKGNLLKHEETHNIQSYKCDFCDKIFTNKDSHKLHNKTIHEKGESYCCDICGKTFVLVHQLRTHHRTYHENNAYVCVYCGAVTRLRNSIRRHLLRKHIELKEEWSQAGAIKAMFGKHLEDISNVNHNDESGESSKNGEELPNYETYALEVSPSTSAKDTLEHINNEKCELSQIREENPEENSLNPEETIPKLGFIECEIIHSDLIETRINSDFIESEINSPDLIDSRIQLDSVEIIENGINCEVYSESPVIDSTLPNQLELMIDGGNFCVQDEVDQRTDIEDNEMLTTSEIELQQKSLLNFLKLNEKSENDDEDVLRGEIIETIDGHQIFVTNSQKEGLQYQLLQREDDIVSLGKENDDENDDENGEKLMKENCERVTGFTTGQGNENALQHIVLTEEQMREFQLEVGTAETIILEDGTVIRQSGTNNSDSNVLLYVVTTSEENSNEIITQSNI